MVESIITAIITGGLALIGVIVTVISSNKSIENKLAVSQAVTDTKLEILTEEVKKHNNFAVRMPVIEEQIKSMNHRIKDLEDLHKENKE